MTPDGRKTVSPSDVYAGEVAMIETIQTHEGQTGASATLIAGRFDTDIQDHNEA